MTGTGRDKEFVYLKELIGISDKQESYIPCAEEQLRKHNPVNIHIKNEEIIPKLEEQTRSLRRATSFYDKNLSAWRHSKEKL